MSEPNPAPKKLHLAETPEKQKAWMAQWRLAEEGLLEMKRQELRAMTDDEAIASFNALDMPPEMIFRFPDREMSLGFAEQQRIFQRARARPVNPLFAPAVSSAKGCRCNAGGTTAVSSPSGW